MSKSRLFLVLRKKEDNAVAEIVGAILLFAVVITLFTSFMVWYVPNATASNESHYELATKQAFGSLVADLHNTNFNSGTTLSENIPLGVPGIPILSAAQDTEFSILPGSSAFNASLTFSILIYATNSTGVVSAHYINKTYSAKGILASNGNTEYITPINYIIEDGTLFQNFGDEQPANSLGPMPLGVSSNGSFYGIQLEIFGIRGSSVTYSSSQSQVVSFVTNYSQAFTHSNDTASVLNGTQYVIQNITLDSLNYSLQGDLANAWNYGMFTSFNNTQLSYANVTSLPFWSFSGVPFKATATPTALYITNLTAIPLSSVSIQAVYLSGS